MKTYLFTYLAALVMFGGSVVYSQPNTNTPSASELRQLIQDAEKGDGVAQARLGRCYSAGRGVERNYAQAVKWSRLAAEQGNAQGQNNLGAYFYTGQGVEKNDVEAAKWFRKSAEQGNAVAQYNLAACYYNGVGVAKSVQVSYGWCLLAESGGEESAVDMALQLKGELSAAEQQAAQQWVRSWKIKDR